MYELDKTTMYKLFQYGHVGGAELTVTDGKNDIHITSEYVYIYTDFAKEAGVKARPNKLNPTFTHILDPTDFERVLVAMGCFCTDERPTFGKFDALRGSAKAMQSNNFKPCLLVIGSNVINLNLVYRFKIEPLQGSANYKFTVWTSADNYDVQTLEINAQTVEQITRVIDKYNAL